MKKFFAAALAALMLLSCTACGGADGNTDPPAEPVNLALIAGIADGEPMVENIPDEFSALVSESGSDYAIISAEGSPQVLDSGPIADLSDRGYSKGTFQLAQRDMTADLLSKFNYTPSTPEIDMASALTLAVRQLTASAQDGRENVLVLTCSGRSTTGIINMVDTPPCELDPDLSAQETAAHLDINMSGVDEVVWYFLGDAGGFSASEKTALKSFYSALFQALGFAGTLEFKADLPSGETYCFDASVSPIRTKEEGSGLRAITPDELTAEDDTALIDTPVMLMDEQVQFRPDSAEFLDEAAAVEALQPVIGFLSSHADVDLILYGTCAGDGDGDFTRALSLSRAGAVRDLLYGAGISERRLTCLEVGCADDPYYQPNLGTGPAGAVNRKVVLTDSRSELAQQLLSISG